MIVVASRNGRVGILAAVEVLRAGGSAVDAVETGIRLVEDNPEEHSVGLGGLPNILGQVELDASIMRGSDRMAGAVGSLRGFRHPISVARQVMESLPHVLLVGAGAERFAAEMGAERGELLTEEAERIWAEKQALLPPEIAAGLQNGADLAPWVAYLTDPVRSRGTVNFLAQDAHGEICCGVSTSGWFNKYPGRLGDSPLIGAGGYADNRYGAAACTGLGEMAIRAGTARSLVLYMKMGMSVQEAGQQAMRDLDELGGNYLSDMNIIALDAQGSPAGFTNESEGKFVYMRAEMSEPQEVERTFVATRRRWAETP